MKEQHDHLERWKDSEPGLFRLTIFILFSSCLGILALVAAIIILKLPIW